MDFEYPDRTKALLEKAIGRPNDIKLIRRQLGAYERDPARDRDRSQHTGMLVYGNQARGRWSRVSALADPRRIFASITRWT